MKIRSFETPKSVLAKIGPNPRIIADDVWAKLVWAGLNLTAEDLPKRGPFRRKPLESSYPVELCKALAVMFRLPVIREWLRSIQPEFLVRILVDCRTTTSS